VYSKRGTWVFDKYPLPTLLVGLGTGTYILEIFRRAGMRQGQVFEKFTSARFYLHIPSGGLEIFLVPAPTLVWTLQNPIKVGR